MAVGVALGYFAQASRGFINRFQVGTTNIPIAIGLILMMYPPLAKVRYEELGDVFRDWKILTHVAGAELGDRPGADVHAGGDLPARLPRLYGGLILIGLARCIAMVIVWNDLAKGDTEYAAGLVAFNSIFQVLFYSVFAYFYITVLPLAGAGERRCAGQHVGDRAERLHLPGHSVHRRLPHALVLVRAKGKEWYHTSLHPQDQPHHADRAALHHCGDVQPQGQLIVTIPLDVVRIAIPLILYFVIMFLISFFMGVWTHAGYKQEHNALLHRGQQQL
jgi:ACR3 family arsenite transporter